jgi:hypothetical protein
MRNLAKDTHPRLSKPSYLWRDVFRDLASNLSDAEGQSKLTYLGLSGGLGTAKSG